MADGLRDVLRQQCRSLIRGLDEIRGRRAEMLVWDDVEPSPPHETVADVCMHLGSIIDECIMQAMTATVPETNDEPLTLDTLRCAQAAMRGINPYLDNPYYEYAAGLATLDYGRCLRDNGEAEKRGEALLLEHLSPSQKKSYEKHQYFDVKGGDTGKTYRITKGRQMNVYELDKRGEKVCGWCFLLSGNLCVGDTMFGQKIALEVEERQALKVANKFAVGGNRMTNCSFVGGAERVMCWLDREAFGQLAYVPQLWYRTCRLSHRAVGYEGRQNVSEGVRISHRCPAHYQADRGVLFSHPCHRASQARAN